METVYFQLHIHAMCNQQYMYSKYIIKLSISVDRKQNLLISYVEVQKHEF